MKKAKCCNTCWWFDKHWGVCSNGKSEMAGAFVYEEKDIDFYKCRHYRKDIDEKECENTKEEL